MLRVQGEALTFDDVLLVPGESEVVAKDVKLQTRLTRDITLNIPLMSAAMDTVTESKLAIAIAQEGGIGIVHKNMTPEQQAEEVRAVKRFESGVVREPVAVALAVVEDRRVEPRAHVLEVALQRGARDLAGLSQLLEAHAVPVLELLVDLVEAFGAVHRADPHACAAAVGQRPEPAGYTHSRPSAAIAPRRVGQA